MCNNNSACKKSTLDELNTQIKDRKQEGFLSCCGCEKDLSIPTVTHTMCTLCVCVCNEAEIPLPPTLLYEGTVTLFCPSQIHTKTDLKSDYNVYYIKVIMKRNIRERSWPAFTKVLCVFVNKGSAKSRNADVNVKLLLCYPGGFSTKNNSMHIALLCLYCLYL